MKKTAPALPRKRFFLEMFTRDISLEDCLLDLIDNCIDGLIKRTSGRLLECLLSMQPRESKAPLPKIEVVLRPNDVSVSDNCGGIPLSSALDDVFCFGHNDDPEDSWLGAYGVGLKRAIFKIGEEFEMTSRTLKDGFQVKVDLTEWAKKDDSYEDWTFPLTTTAPASRANLAGTTIKFTKLRKEIAERLRDPIVERSFVKSIARTYAFFLGREVRVLVNGQDIKGQDVPVGQSDEVQAYRRELVHNDVTIKIVASLAPSSRRTYETAGWYVLCNGRAVISADKSDVTGWGEQRLPTFHTKYTGFIGVVLLRSERPLLLPWTTTKRALNREAAVYQVVLREMVAAARPVLTFLNRMYPSEASASIPERAVAETVRPVGVLELASKSNQPFATKGPRVSKETVRVQYDASRAELDRARRQLREPSMPAHRVGRVTFEHYLKTECGK